MNNFMKIILGIGLMVMFLMIRIPVAIAHTNLIDSVPAPGEVLDQSPSEVRLTFNESISLESSFEIFGENFKRVEGISPEINLVTPSEMIACIPPLQPGTYTLQWTAISADGHSATGSFSFAISASNERLDIKWLLPVGVLITGGIVFGLVWGRRKSSE